MYNKNIAYSNGTFLMIEDYGNDKFYIIVCDESKLEITNTKMVVIDTFTDGLTNDDIKYYISELLKNTNYEIECEIEEFENSELFQLLINND